MKKRIIEGRPPIYGEPLKLATIRIRQDQIDWLDAEAEKQGISKNELVRNIIDEVKERIENK